MCFNCLGASVTTNFGLSHYQWDNVFPQSLSITTDFSLVGNKWGDELPLGSSGGDVTFSFAQQNFATQLAEFDSFITGETLKNDIEVALGAWESVADIRFVEVADSTAVDIRFGWRDIDGEGGVLGQTTVPSAGPLSSVIVALDESENWFFGGVSPANQIDFSTVTTHEVGHAIGIAHSSSSQAIMNAVYSSDILTLQQDDIDAAKEIYGPNQVDAIDVFRFYNPDLGAHLFTTDQVEKISIEKNTSFRQEGIGFKALSNVDTDKEGVVPVYRFYNSELGSHFFTAFEKEKDHVLTLDAFVYEGEGFKAFSSDSILTTPIFRFFNFETGGHFFTADVAERDVVMNIPQLRYEGEAFYAFNDL